VAVIATATVAMRMMMPMAMMKVAIKMIIICCNRCNRPSPF
jgi:hypothetical protein